MVDTRHPGLYVIEEPATPTITGVGITTAGFVGLAEKGQVEKARLITSLAQFEKEFGKAHKINGTFVYLWFAVRAFFNEGGTACYVMRIVPTDSATASVDIDGHNLGATSPKLATATALNTGEWGNLLTLRCQKAQAKIQTAVSASTNQSDSFTVDDVRGLEVGDLCHIEGITWAVGRSVRPISRIDTSGANPVIHLAGSNAVNTTAIAVDTEVHFVTTHRFRSRLVNQPTFAEGTGVVGENYVDVTLGTSANVVPGQLLCVVGEDTSTSPNQTGFFYFTVKSATTLGDKDRIFFDNVGTLQGDVESDLSPGAGSSPAGYISTFDVGATIVSIEFDLDLFFKGNLLESHKFLSMSRENTRDFIGGTVSGANRNGRLLGESENQSTHIQVVTEAAANDDSDPLALAEATLLTQGVVAFASGSDGTNDATNVPSTKFTGAIDLIKEIDDISVLAVPDAAGSTVVQQKICDVADSLKTMVGLVDPLLSDSEGTSAVQNSIAWRNSTLNRDTSYAAMYWPWLVVEDPSVSDSAVTDPGAFSTGFGFPTVKIPPSGHVAGQYARAVIDVGPHKTPANVPLRGVIDVTKRITDSDQDFLNPDGVNAIRFFPGEGTRVWGGRTLFSTTNGKHYVAVRRLLIFIERSIKEGNRFAVFQPNDPRLWQKIESANRQFMRDQWRQGRLFPSDDEEKAYFVRCDETTTDKGDREAGRVNCLVGVNAPFPAEFVIFRVSLFDGATSIEEVVSGTNAAGTLF